MNSFEFARATSVAQARELLAEKPGAVLKAGGIDLLDHLKERLVEPPRVVDLKSIVDLKFFLLLRTHRVERGPKAATKCSIIVS